MTLDIKLRAQKKFIKNNKNLSYRHRIKALKSLEEALKRREVEIYQAFREDFGKASFEVYMTEMGRLYKCFKDVYKSLGQWMAVEKVKTPITLFPAKSYIVREAYGSVLIIAPNNYPLLLALEPLIMAIAAGNTAVVKLAESTEKVSNIVEEIIREAFMEEYVLPLRGGQSETSEAINLPFDKIFFTGSSRVGKIVLEAAAKNLTPVTLELGGKSPAIVTKNANLSLAAKRISRGKLLNGGQTCIAPDYVLVEKSVKDKLVNFLKEEFKKFYGTSPQENSEFTKMINGAYVERLAKLLEKTQGNIVFGGRIQIEHNYIAPTIVDNVYWDDSLMEEELFGPILPIITYDDLDSAIETLQSKDKPLALYVFTKKRREAERLINKISFGGGMVNDTLLHFANDNLPFGGIGNSGMGMSHGKWGFEEFCHKKALVKRPSRFQMDFLKPPYMNRHKLLKFIYK